MTATLLTDTERAALRNRFPTLVREQEVIPLAGATLTDRHFPPIRAGTPRAGADCYEPEVRLPVDWADVLGTVAGLAIVAASWGTIIYRIARGVWPWQ